MPDFLPNAGLPDDATISPGTEPGLYRDTHRVLAEWIQDIGEWTSSLKAGYSREDFDAAYDLDITEARAVWGLFAFVTEEDREDWSFEYSIASPVDRPIRGKLGVYYYNFEADFIQRSNTGPFAIFGVPPGTRFGDPRLNDITNKSLFGGISFDLADNWVLDFEARWAKDEKEITSGQLSEELIDADAGNYDPDFSIYSLPVNDSLSFTNFTPRVTLSWQYNDDINLYALVAKGNKPGGFNREYYLAAVDPEMRSARDALRAKRRELVKVQDRVPEIMAMEELAEPRTAYILARGLYDQPLEAVQPDTPEALSSFPEGEPRNRLGLARWLFSSENPLTARVAVNRLWQLVFGQGLVATTENFGTQGTPPANPELLDHLALSFAASGWDIKAMLKRLVMSSTFRQSSRSGGHGPRRRLSAEMMRDHALAASGLLVEKVGGPGVKPYQPAGLWKEKSGQTYQRGKGADLYRRSLYTFWKRTSPPPSMMIFDAAKRDVCIARRQSTSSPLQALVLMNDPQFIEASRALAQRAVQEGGESETDRITFCFRLLTSRHPSQRELEVLVRLLQGSLTELRADPESVGELHAVGDFQVDESADATELAAYAVVCSTILSYDAAVMIR